MHEVKSGSFVENTHVSHLIYADDTYCFSPSLQDILKICNDFAEKHEIVFNCTKSLGLLFCCKQFKISSSPQVHLLNKDVSFVNSVKYLGVFIISTLSDDNNIARQIHCLYSAATWSKIDFANCSENLENYLFNNVLRFMWAIYGVSFEFQFTSSVSSTR